MKNNRLLYDYLFSKELSLDRLHEKISKMSVSEIINHTEKIHDLVYIDREKANSNFDFIANTSLSGITGQCGSIDCRLTNLNHLTRKSILYANKVWIKFPLSDYAIYTEYNVDLDFLQEKFMDDLTIIHNYRQLIESGIFAFAKTEQHFCFNCFGSLSEQVNWPMVKRVKSLKKELQQQFWKGANYSLDGPFGPEDEFRLNINVKDQRLFEHEGLSYSIHNVEKEFPRALIHKAQKVNKTELLNSRQLELIVNNVLQSIVMQNWYSENYNANYLTNTPVELDAIKFLNDKSTNLNSDLLYDNLSHTLPIIEKVRIEKLIELRQKEPEAFITYRNSVDSLLNKSKSLNSKEMKEAFKDEIQPSIDKMKQTINLNKRKIIKDSLHSLVTGSSLVSIGLFSGILPTGIGAAVAGLALYHQGTKLLDKTKELITNDYE